MHLKVRRSPDALERFERQTAIPMLVLSVAIVPLLLAPLLFDLSEGTSSTVVAIDWIIWAIFAVEYGTRLLLAPVKLQFIRSNKIDLLVVLLPFLRPLRVVRSARGLRVLRAARTATYLGRAILATQDVLTRHKLHYAVSVTGLVAVAGALLVESFERGAPDSNISSIPDALWWAIATVTTVGYGDRFPVTAAGRGVAVVLMIMGIALFGFLAGSLASFFLEKREDQPEEDPQLREINERLSRIEQYLAAEGQRRET